MRCLSPIQTGKRGEQVTVPCSQCLPCRLTRRDQWACRALLEPRNGLRPSFWTLTISEDNISTLDTDGPRLMVRRFLDSLRLSERRSGNPLPIRSFGSLDYGGLFGRPHFHFLIWNLCENWLPQEPYRKSLPRIRYSIAHWPHGHVDSAPFNPQTARYVSRYVAGIWTPTELQDTSSDPLPRMNFHATRPGLGLIGLRSYLLQIASSPTRGWIHPATISLDGRNWPIHPTLRSYWQKWTTELGIQTDLLSKSELRTMQALEREFESTSQGARLVRKEIDRAEHLAKTFTLKQQKEHAELIRVLDRKLNGPERLTA